jgi:transcription antitermination factor NusG
MFEAPIDEQTWRVVQTRRHKERAVAARLRDRGLQAYVPLVRHWPPPEVGAAVGPMFPCYAFVRASIANFHVLGHTPGVHKIVTFGDWPARLDPAVIGMLHDREGRDGIIRLADPAPGTDVVITDGPLRGFAAVLERRCSSRDRVLVLLQFLERQARVEMPDSWVRLA